MTKFQIIKLHVNFYPLLEYLVRYGIYIYIIYILFGPNYGPVAHQG